MNIPATVTVGPHTYTIDAGQAASRGVRGEGRLGHNNVDYHVIDIDSDRPESAVAESVIHEILHACWRPSGISFTRRQKRRIARHLKHGRIDQAQRIILDQLNGTSRHLRRLILRGWL